MSSMQRTGPFQRGRRDAGRKRFTLRRQQHYRRGFVAQGLCFLVVYPRVTGYHADILSHQRKRFGITVLALAQPVDRIRVGRIAGQMETAQALNRDDVAIPDQFGSAADRIIVVGLGGCAMLTHPTIYQFYQWM